MQNLLSHIHLYVPPRTVVHHVPLSMGFSGQEYSSGLSCPPPGDLPDRGMESKYMYISCIGRQVLSHWAIHGCQLHPNQQGGLNASYKWLKASYRCCLQSRGRFAQGWEHQEVRRTGTTVNTEVMGDCLCGGRQPLVSRLELWQGVRYRPKVTGSLWGRQIDFKA